MRKNDEWVELFVGRHYMGSLALLNRIAPGAQRGEAGLVFHVIANLGVAPLGVGFGVTVVRLFAAVAGFAIIVGLLSAGPAAVSWCQAR